MVPNRAKHHILSSRFQVKKIHCKKRLIKTLVLNQHHIFSYVNINDVIQIFLQDESLKKNFLQLIIINIHKLSV